MHLSRNRQGTKMCTGRHQHSHRHGIRFELCQAHPIEQCNCISRRRATRVPSEISPFSPPPTQSRSPRERAMASASESEMQPLAPAGYRRTPEMKEKVDASAVDLEAGTGETLYPGISRGESALRWGFVRKVYGILAAQLLLTTAVSAATVLHPTLNATLSDSAGLALVLAVLPFILMIPLYHYQHKHPHNFVFLGLFTLCLSFSIGVACANTQGKIVLEALVLTAGVVASLTAYAFWASKKGKEFGYLGPILSSALTILVLTSFLQIFFPLGPVSHALFGGLGALVFSGFILYDTENLIRRHTYDEYIWASVGLYLDILNLFLSILNMLRSMQSDN